MQCECRIINKCLYRYSWRIEINPRQPIKHQLYQSRKSKYGKESSHLISGILKKSKEKAIMNPPEIIENKTPLSLLFHILSPVASLPTNQPLLPIKSSPELMPWFHHLALQDGIPDDILAVFWSYSGQPDPL